jgi:hypothetical protein
MAAFTDEDLKTEHLIPRQRSGLLPKRTYLIRRGNEKALRRV